LLVNFNEKRYCRITLSEINWKLQKIAVVNKTKYAILLLGVN